MHATNLITNHDFHFLDDLEIAPDFYEYFLGTFPLLRADKTIMCVSCWNDNGKKGLIDEFRPDLLYRSDFFPGLGWMMSRELWDEIGPKFPRAFWDDWIREKEQRLDRVCIRPELPRTRTFGKVGVSKWVAFRDFFSLCWAKLDFLSRLCSGLFYEKHLKYIELTDQSFQFSTADLTYLLKENYDRTYIDDVYKVPVVTLDELRRDMINVAGPVRILYSNRNQYKSAAKALGIMDDFKVSCDDWFSDELFADCNLHFCRVASLEQHTEESYRHFTKVAACFLPQAWTGRDTILRGASCTKKLISLK